MCLLYARVFDLRCFKYTVCYAALKCVKLMTLAKIIIQYLECLIWLILSLPLLCCCCLLFVIIICCRCMRFNSTCAVVFANAGRLLCSNICSACKPIQTKTLEWLVIDRNGIYGYKSTLTTTLKLSDAITTQQNSRRSKKK